VGPVLEIIGAILALAIGVWLGLPGRYSQSADDIEQMMTSGTPRRRKTKRAFTPLAWVQRHVGGSRVHRRGGRQRGTFKLDTPEDR
jgi:hypothetical protein